jgi:hypothetical protein
MVAVLASSLGQAVASHKTAPAAARVTHASLHALSQLLAQPPVAQALSSGTLGALLGRLLTCLVHPRFASSAGQPADDEQAAQVGRWMNKVLSSVIKKGDPNRLFTVLISNLYHDAPGADKAQFMDAVLKCLLDMTRRMPSYIDTLDIDRLLLDIHKFLSQHPPSQYRGKEFKPLRLLKTIINQLVEIKGLAIRRHLSLVPVDDNPTISSYLDLLFKSQQVEDARAEKDGLAAHETGLAGAPAVHQGEAAHAAEDTSTPTQHTPTPHTKPPAPTDLLLTKYEALRFVLGVLCSEDLSCSLMLLDICSDRCMPLHADAQV